MEVPALLVLGRLSRRFSDLTLIVSGCVAGVGYYVGMALVAGPVALVAMQVVSACSSRSSQGRGWPCSSG